MPHACHVICALSPLDAALTMRFCRNTQRERLVLRLPSEMNTDVSKVLRVPPKMQLIFWKWPKTSGPVTQNDLCVLKHVGWKKWSHGKTSFSQIRRHGSRPCSPDPHQKIARKDVDPRNCSAKSFRWPAIHTMQPPFSTPSCSWRNWKSCFACVK